MRGKFLQIVGEVQLGNLTRKVRNDYSHVLFGSDTKRILGFPDEGGCTDSTTGKQKSEIQNWGSNYISFTEC